MYGVASKKPTTVLLRQVDVGAFAAHRCSGDHRHGSLLGYTATGGFRTAAAASYPPLLNRALA
eukprot:9226207-Lingulodinium_polyedra.AAC.1